MNLTNLSLRHTQEMHEIAKKSLVKTIVDLIKRNCNTMIHLNLVRISDEVEEGELILSALANSKIRKLVVLNLNENPAWFTSEQIIENLCRVISLQNKLQRIKCGTQNKLTAAATLKIMKAISASECLKTLRYLELQWCNWDDEQNCEELANLVANAPSLKEVWIGAQKGTSDLKIKLEVSSEFVAVERVSSGEVVSSVERACNTVRISVKDGVKRATNRQ